jgi:hypothetical protein
MRRFRFMIGLLAALVIPSVAQAQIISITIAPPELRATAASRAWVHLDARVLGLRPGRILLGSGHLGGAAGCWPVVDTRLLGVA